MVVVGAQRGLFAPGEVRQAVATLRPSEGVANGLKMPAVKQSWRPSPFPPPKPQTLPLGGQ